MSESDVGASLLRPDLGPAYMVPLLHEFDILLVLYKIIQLQYGRGGEDPSRSAGTSSEADSPAIY